MFDSPLLNRPHRVGAPYKPGRKIWREGVEFACGERAHQLELFLRHPRRQELESISSGPAEFALTVEQEVLFLLFRFSPGIPWGAAPASRHGLVDAAAAPSGQRAFLQVLLVDAATGLLTTVRMLSFDIAFSDQLRYQIQIQASKGWTDLKMRRRLAAIHRTIAEPDILLQRSLARCGYG